MASYTGTSHHATRIQRLEDERKKMHAEVETQKSAIAGTAAAAVDFGTKFASHTESVEDLLKKDTVGLVTFSDFKARREHLERCAAAERHKRDAEQREKDATERKRKLKQANKATLSFADDEEEEEEDEAEEPVQPRAKKNPDSLVGTDPAASQIAKRLRLGKNPDVDTTFIPDRDRELAEQAERERLKQEWINEQERIKNEMVMITYSYWDGTGHRRTVQCRKGTTVGKFLAIVQQEFHELRNVSPDMLMLIKEDLIIPHHYTFYDFIVTKARGKSGPLFNFGVHEDVRLVNDANKEKQDAHAAKVVERRWYERNRHIFPASRWEVYDPSKRYDNYTIHGGEVN